MQLKLAVVLTNPVNNNNNNNGNQWEPRLGLNFAPLLISHAETQDLFSSATAEAIFKS
jgi:hypothetical protein